MLHDYCVFCDLWNRYTGQCTYDKCPADEEPDKESPTKDAAYMWWAEVVDRPDPDEEAAHKRYLRENDGGDHYPDNSYYD